VPKEDWMHIQDFCREIRNEKKTIIILNFTRHDIISSELESGAHELVVVEMKNGIKDIPIAIWNEIGKEVASLIFSYINLGRDIDLYINTLVTLAFIIGRIVGPSERIMLCERNPYLKKLIRCFSLTDKSLQNY
jgi:hypothetical protein